MSTDNTWTTEPDDEEQPKDEEPQEYHPKARLVLVDSDKAEWGVVKDCQGNINFIPEDAEVVGTWNKYGEGVFWVSLTTALEALSDRAIQLTKELAEQRHLTPVKAQKTTSKRTTAEPQAAVTEAETEQAEATARIGSIRERLSR